MWKLLASLLLLLAATPAQSQCGGFNCTAPTPPVGDNSNQIATTAFVVQNAVAGGKPLGTGVTAASVGAKCDGVTDDAPAIQGLINSFAATGGTILFPAGNCVIASSLVISNSGTTLRGQGRDSSTLTYTGTTFGIVYNGSIENVAIIDLTISSASTTNTLVKMSAINTGFTLERALLKGGGTQVLVTSTNGSIGGSYSVRCINSDFQNAALPALYFNPLGNGLVAANYVIGCDFSGFVQQAIYQTNGSGIYVDHSHIERHLGAGATTSAIHVDNSTSTTFSHMWLEDDSNNPFFDIGNNVGNFAIRDSILVLNAAGGVHTSANALKVNGTGCQLISIENVRVSTAGTVGNIWDTGNCPVYGRANGFDAGTAAWGFASTATAAQVDIDDTIQGATPTTFTSGTQQVGVGRLALVINGGALGSPLSVGTMPAFTIGGTVSGGGNQINNVIIGAASPLAGSFTTITASGIISTTGAGSAAAPVISLPNNTGLYGVSTTGLGVTVNGSVKLDYGIGVSAQWTIGGTVVNIANTIALGGTGPGALSTSGAINFNVASDNGIWVNGAQAMSFPSGTQVKLSATDATSTSTGALQVSGGASINKRVWMNGLSAASAGLSAACVENTGEITTNTGVTTCLISGRQFKRDIVTLPDHSDALLLKLQPSTFYWLDKNNGIDQQIGFIADEVGAVDERMAARGKSGEWRTWRQDVVTTLLVQGYQHHDAEIAALKADNDNIRAELNRRAQ